MSFLEDEEGFSVWRRALEALLKQGSTYAEAIEGANLVLRAHLRERDGARRASEEGDRDPE